MNKDRYQSTSARRALALLNSPQLRLLVHVFMQELSIYFPIFIFVFGKMPFGWVVRSRFECLQRYLSAFARTTENRRGNKSCASPVLICI